jgi:hypothetical protein
LIVYTSVSCWEKGHLLDVTITLLIFRQVKRIQNYIMYSHNLRLRRIHNPEGLLIHWWIFLGSCSSSGCGASACDSHRALISYLIEVSKVLTLILNISPFEIFIQILRYAAAVINIELDQVFCAMIHKLIYLEQKIGFTS